MPIPKQAPDVSVDDLQELDNNIDNLFNQYISPIDRIRSKGVPVLSSQGVQNDTDAATSLVSDFKSLQYSNKALESRAHAFYRMLGFPVVGSNNSFYNPGFDPNGAATLQARSKVNATVANNLKTLQNLIYVRERKSQTLSTTFSGQDLNASLYGYLTRYSFPFNLIDENKQPLDVDLQSYSVSDRDDDAFILATNNTTFATDILDAGNKYKTVQHLLKPFVVDYRIENTVTPDGNKIAVPFLKDEKACKITTNVACLRPGLEEIIRLRLSDTTPDVNFLKAVGNILSANNDNLYTKQASLSDLQGVVNALSTQQVVSANTQQILGSDTSIQVTTVTKLIKSIKICASELGKAFVNIDQVKNSVNFVPIFPADGPGGTIGGSAQAGFKTSSSNIDIQIAELNIKKLNVQSRTKEFSNLGNFASPFAIKSFSENTSNLDTQLQTLTAQRESLVKSGLESYRTIELVKGEMSGLGLVDVLAIYTALWSIDIATLISFLDENSFARMIKYNPEYKDIQDVSDRVSAGAKYGIVDAIARFENTLRQILTFADTYINKYQNVSPTLSNGSTLEGQT